jgi:solute carrier family 25 oxoglutarate transporter 11
MNMFYEWPKTR